MVDTGELDNFLNENSAKDNDICEILGEGSLVDRENPTNKQKYKALDIPVKLNGKRELLYSPNKDAVKELQKAFGKDTNKWIGQKFGIKIYPKTAYGVTKNAILPQPIVAQKA
jgi:hypothetical protein